jgi:hypothetical protein
MKKSIWGVLFICAILILVQACAYSEGERTGVISKFSK